MVVTSSVHDLGRHETEDSDETFSFVSTGRQPSSDEDNRSLQWMERSVVKGVNTSSLSSEET